MKKRAKAKSAATAKKGAHAIIQNCHIVGVQETPQMAIAIQSLADAIAQNARAAQSIAFAIQSRARGPMDAPMIQVGDGGNLQLRNTQVNAGDSDWPRSNDSK